MIEIAALTEHDRTPSSRFRIRQYIDPLLTYGIKLKDYKRKYSRQLASDGFQSIKTSPKRLAKATYYDLLNLYQTFKRINHCNKHHLIWLSRQLIINLPYLESFLKKPIIYDLDDAVYLESPLSRMQVNYCAKKADLIFAGNEFLAEYLFKFNNNVHIIPTSVDTEIFKPKTLGIFIDIGCPSITASASMPPTPHPRTDKALTIVVWLSVPTTESGYR